MKPINKNLALATAYKTWLENWERNNLTHPTYNSSNGKFYYDIVANLLWVQKGLCAYTEKFLIDPKRVDPNLWKGGTFNKFEFLGNLDHYDATLKTDKGWAWDNFFMIHTDVNTKVKRDKGVNHILKPDKETFDPFYYLDYDLATHLFFANADREPDEIAKIAHDIFALGLNFQPISDYRKIALAPIIEKVKYRALSIDEARAELHEFYTAFEMAVTQVLAKF